MYEAQDSWSRFARKAARPGALSLDEGSPSRQMSNAATRHAYAGSRTRMAAIVPVSFPTRCPQVRTPLRSTLRPCERARGRPRRGGAPDGKAVIVAEEKIEMDGEVLEALGGGMFRVTLENGHSLSPALSPRLGNL